MTHPDLQTPESRARFAANIDRDVQGMRASARRAVERAELARLLNEIKLNLREARRLVQLLLP